MTTLLAVLFLTLAGCAGGGDEAMPQQSPQATPASEAATVTLLADKTSVLVGEPVTLTGTITPQQPAQEDCWHLSRPVGSVATWKGPPDAGIAVFTPDTAGTYSVRFGCEAVATVYVTATAPPPPPPPPADEPPPVVPPVTLIFEGDVAGGTAHGDWSYALDATPTVINKWGVMNRVYALDRWDVTTVATGNGLPSQTLSNGDGSTAELCIGICNLGGEPRMILRLRQGVWLLQIAFALVNPEQLTPPRFTELGAMRESLYRNEPELTPLSFFVSGSLSTPE